jgi:hypothetical protein
VAVNVALWAGDQWIAAAVAEPFNREMFWTDGLSAFLRTNVQDTPLIPDGGSKLVDLNFDPPFPNAPAFQVEAIYCSIEQKAIDGAAVLAEACGLPVHHVAALGENDRSATGYLPKTEFEVTADAFFAQPSESIRGWERAINAQTRILDAVGHIVSTTPGTGPMVIVSHGGVGTLLLCHLKGMPISRTEEQPGTTGGNYLIFPFGTFIQ